MILRKVEHTIKYNIGILPRGVYKGLRVYESTPPRGSKSNRAATIHTATINTTSSGTTARQHHLRFTPFLPLRQPRVCCYFLCVCKCSAVCSVHNKGRLLVHAIVILRTYLPYNLKIKHTDESSNFILPPQQTVRTYASRARRQNRGACGRDDALPHFNFRHPWGSKTQPTSRGQTLPYTCPTTNPPGYQHELSSGKKTRETPNRGEKKSAALRVN